MNRQGRRIGRKVRQTPKRKRNPRFSPFAECVRAGAFRRASPGREHIGSARRLRYETAVEGSGLILGGTYWRPDQIVRDLGPIALGHIPPDGPRSARPFLAVRCALACQLWPPPGQARRQARGHFKTAYREGEAPTEPCWTRFSP
jgi:hypothetical protein